MPGMPLPPPTKFESLLSFTAHPIDSIWTSVGRCFGNMCIRPGNDLWRILHCFGVIPQRIQPLKIDMARKAKRLMYCVFAMADVLEPALAEVQNLLLVVAQWSVRLPTRELKEPLAGDLLAHFALFQIRTSVRGVYTPVGFQPHFACASATAFAG